MTSRSKNACVDGVFTSQESVFSNDMSLPDRVHTFIDLRTASSDYTDDSLTFHVLQEKEKSLGSPGSRTRLNKENNTS